MRIEAAPKCQDSGEFLRHDDGESDDEYHVR